MMDERDEKRAAPDENSNSKNTDFTDLRSVTRDSVTGGSSKNAAGKDAWDPQQYQKFQQERAKPFFDLQDLLEPLPGGRVADLGCGPGKLTPGLHAFVQAAETIGVDASDAMLSKTTSYSGQGVRFLKSDLRNISALGKFDLLFSNAAIQWVPDHEKVFQALYDQLLPGGQLAVQMPDNNSHPSHALIHALAKEEPYVSALGGFSNHSSVLRPEQYALMLKKLGLKEQDVHLRVYTHELPNVAAVVEWVKGSVLTAYEKRLTPSVFSDFVKEYEKRLYAELGDPKPFHYTFRRVFIWGRK